MGSPELLRFPWSTPPPKFSVVLLLGVDPPRQDRAASGGAFPPSAKKALVLLRLGG